MADGSRYLKCDGCGAVLDRRPLDDWKDGGTYRYGRERELFSRAKELGWTWPSTQDRHYCPKCSGVIEQSAPDTAKK
jgi:hypothetical protein